MSAGVATARPNALDVDVVVEGDDEADAALPVATAARLGPPLPISRLFADAFYARGRLGVTDRGAGGPNTLKGAKPLGLA